MRAPEGDPRIHANERAMRSPIGRPRRNARQSHIWYVTMRMAPHTLGFIAPPTSIATILRTRSGRFASNLNEYMLLVGETQGRVVINRGWNKETSAEVRSKKKVEGTAGVNI